MCADVVEVCWVEAGKTTRRMTALWEDISASGACLQLEEAVPLGVELRWKCRRQSFTGRVRYCVYREIGYYVGVEFDAGSKWTENAYKPRHLLNPAKMAEGGIPEAKGIKAN